MTSDTTPGSGTVFTIGHGDRDFGDFCRRCAPYGITTVADVRSVPYSRHAPDFSKGELEELCAEAGLGYRWLGNHLGGRPHDGPSPTERPASDADTPAASSELTAGMAELEGLAAGAVVVILCSELEPAHCHRTTSIAPALAASGHEVHHIMEDGTLTLYQPPLAL